MAQHGLPRKYEDVLTTLDNKSIQFELEGHHKKEDVNCDLIMVVCATNTPANVPSHAIFHSCYISIAINI